MKDTHDFNQMKIMLASPEQIRAWSYGEVTKPETINYRTLRPERDGLFCEKIFGTTKEWECYCGKFKSGRYKGVICDRCGVEVTHITVRRQRMGHIDLACPVSHIWYYKTTPSRMGTLLDLKMADLEAVLYYEKHIVIDAGDTELKKCQILTEAELDEAQNLYENNFTVGMGAEAIQTLLANLDLDTLYHELRQKMIEKGDKDKKILKRLSEVEDFRGSGNKPEWMILNVVPVIPPDLRPMVQLDGGRFATSDLNDLYRRVINRNNRLKRLIEIQAPDVIVRNEKRMLQEAVDSLFDNSKKKKKAKGSSNRELKSLSDMLKGKQGRFRQNLLGKRVDYSGRSVIVVGPSLRMHQCGLPTKMALELFKPFIMARIVKKHGNEYSSTRAGKMVEQEDPYVFSILDEVVKEHPVLLNRAPTLHRLGIQAFEPVLIEGKAIRLHPLVCHAFNADFDGDQMAVHVPLTEAAQIECMTLMLSVNNLLDPANGNPVAYPSQDMVLGINYLTKARKGAKGEGKYFDNTNEVMLAIDAKAIDYQAVCKVKVNGVVYETTPGRVVFNLAMPVGIEFVNELLGDKELKKLIAKNYKQFGSSVTVKMLDAIKDVGYKYATIFGATISISDILIPEEKADMIQSANAEVAKIDDQYHKGMMSEDERYSKVIDLWSDTNEKLTNTLMETLKNDKDGFNPIYMMADSGARGSRNQIRQLSGMRGLMAKPNGTIIDIPIRSNFKEGLSIIEFFISTNGARKGLADTALKTAEAGYLTRRLVDIAQDVVVNEEDCGTINGLDMLAIKNGDEIIETLEDRIQGCFSLEQIKHPITNEVLLDVNQEITDELAEQIDEIGIEKVKIRTVLTCEAKHGVCAKCYGRNLANNRKVNIGEAVGIIAAQSIGQPGTQLTMRTFHVGGTASKIAEDNELTIKYNVYLKDVLGNTVISEDGRTLFTRKGKLIVAKLLQSEEVGAGDAKFQNGQKVVEGDLLFTGAGKEIVADCVGFVQYAEGQVLVLAQDQMIDVRSGSELMVTKDTVVHAGEILVTFDLYAEPIIAEQSGTVKYLDMINGATLKEETNADTGVTVKRISDNASESLQPRLAILDADGEVLANYFMPGGAYIQIENGTEITMGQILAKIPKAASKTNDITSGLPRVGDLFEARPPKTEAILAEISGIVRFKNIVKGKQVVVVEDAYGGTAKHQIPMGKFLLVRDGDTVEAGEMLSDGNLNPHDVLRIQGENALQTFLMNEVQAVYQAQGVKISDKHIGVIVRQMMRKVEIVAVGDTSFIYGKQVDRFKFFEENERVIRNGGQPAVAKPVLMGITKAALKIDSFLSAASFQETTKVLTNAAIAGSIDELRGLKENIIIGHKIPAGTGKKEYRNLKLKNMPSEEIETQVRDIMEARHHEMDSAIEDEFDIEDEDDFAEDYGDEDMESGEDEE